MIIRKKYIKPAMKVYEIESAQLLSSSSYEGVDETEVNFGEGYPDEKG